jgi:rSAM/selenodomain-associated transferase 2
MMISVIIPARNEEHTLPALLTQINCSKHNAVVEVIVSDGNSDDGTRAIASHYGCRVVTCQSAGRALQLNSGAQHARGDILYFVHADSILPEQFSTDIVRHVHSGYDAGCYQLKFDLNHWFLKFNAWFTRFSSPYFRFGDQSLFVKRSVFTAIGGFNEHYALLEDQEIVKRLCRSYSFCVMPDYILTSARKYRTHGVYRLQFIYYYLYTLYAFGASQDTLVKTYHRLIQN